MPAMVFNNNVDFGVTYTSELVGFPKKCLPSFTDQFVLRVGLTSVLHRHSNHGGFVMSPTRACQNLCTNIV